jgi:hypothetical protein
LVAWERVLISLITQMPAHAVQSLRVMTSDSTTLSWSMLPVQEIWLPLSEEEEGTGPMLMRLQGRAQLVDSFLREVDTRPGRQLLVATRELREAQAERGGNDSAAART